MGLGFECHSSYWEGLKTIIGCHFLTLWRLNPCGFPQHRENPEFTETHIQYAIHVWTCTRDNSHMLTVAVYDLISNGVLVGQILIVKEVLPALGLIEVSNLSWWREKKMDTCLK